MLCIALSIQESFQDSEINNGPKFQLCIGIHVGPCFTTILGFHVFKTGIFGTILPETALIHGTGLGQKCHVSKQVKQCINFDDFVFIKRGQLVIENEHGKYDKMVDTYWVFWSHDEHCEGLIEYVADGSETQSQMTADTS